MFNDNGSFLLALFEFFLFFAWFMCLFWVFGDIFRSSDLGGGGKTIWVIFVILIPWLGIFVYLIARGGGMQQRNWSRRRRACGTGGLHPVRGEVLPSVGDRSDRFGQVAAGLGCHHAGRVRCPEVQGPRLAPAPDFSPAARR